MIANIKEIEIEKISLYIVFFLLLIFYLVVNISDYLENEKYNKVVASCVLKYGFEGALTTTTGYFCVNYTKYERLDNLERGEE